MRVRFVVAAPSRVSGRGAPYLPGRPHHARDVGSGIDGALCAGQNHDTAGWALCYLFGSVPLVLCNVYEEKAFDETPIHISYMLGWLVLWQFVSIVACAPFDMIQGFGATTPSNFAQHQLDGLNCFFNTGDAPATCEGAWLPITLFILACECQTPCKHA